ncbi:MAG: type II toxin-antitoxin system RelE/ParE family toxin [Pseudohongiellaceae bacterium]
MAEIVNIINEYTDVHGNSPYAEWLDNLSDKVAKTKIVNQVDRMVLGLFGDVESIGEGLSELRIHYGPGYRVYFGKQGKQIYLLLCGGDKSTQPKDIKKAKTCWNDHKRRNQP